MDWNEIKAWRKERRAELVARREAFAAEERRRWNDVITGHLEHALHVPPASVVGFCWPFKGEFDARYAVRHWRDRGVTAALPEVVGKGQPLQFRKWWPGVEMHPGVYDIPVPSNTEIVVPDIAIVPMNGYDEQAYRLGYGGGYFDRTLAKWRNGIFAVGVSYSALKLTTIFPQAHDIAMDVVVTEEGVHRAAAGALLRMTVEEAHDYMVSVLAARALPRAAPVDPHAGLSSPPCYAGEFPGHWDGTEPPPKT